MVVPANNFVDVAAYSMAGMKFLDNYRPAIKYANKKFKDFQRVPGNRGIVTTWELTPKVVFVPGTLVVAAFDSTDQRIHTHTNNEKGYVAHAIDAEEEIYNDAYDYMKRIGRAAMIGIGDAVEANIVNRFLETYRFFELDDNSLLTYRNLAAAISVFDNYGTQRDPDQYMFVPDILMPSFIDNGLNQFATSRNNDIANTWEVGDITGTKVLSAQILPEHVAGAGPNLVAPDTLTLITVSLDGGTLTFGGASIDTSGTPGVFYFNKGDVFEFKLDTVNGPLKYLFFNNGSNSNLVSANNVQCVVDADTDSDGAGVVIVTINNNATGGRNPLIFDPGVSKENNLSRALVTGAPGTGDEIRVIGNHRVGLICNSQALFASLPRLPNEGPYMSSFNDPDPSSGISVRLTYGAKPFEDFKGFVWSVYFGTSIVPENAMRLIFESNPGAVPLMMYDKLTRDNKLAGSLKSKTVWAPIRHSQTGEVVDIPPSKVGIAQKHDIEKAKEAARAKAKAKAKG